MSDIVAKFFQAADSRDPNAVLQYLTDDVRWTFGNAQTVIGRTGVREALTFFFQHVAAMSHAIVGQWRCDDCIAVQTLASYRDAFGRAFQFPACNLLFLQQNLIGEVRVFVDNHALFEPPEDA
jgi:ketosteroid isomerase-like protein